MDLTRSSYSYTEDIDRQFRDEALGENKAADRRSKLLSCLKAPQGEKNIR